MSVLLRFLPLSSEALLPLRALIKKELMLFFFSPLAWLVCFFFLLAWGGFFFLASLAPIFSFSIPLENMVFFLLFLTPLLTMRLFAEEKKQHTLVLLLTSTLSGLEIVLGKYCAVLVFYSFLLLASFFVPLYLSRHFVLVPYEVFLAYLELFLLGAALLGLGLATSAATENQLSAALLAFCFNLFFYLSSALAQFFPPFWAKWVGHFSFLSQLRAFRQGVFELQTVAYFIFLSGLALAFAKLFLDFSYREAS